MLLLQTDGYRAYSVACIQEELRGVGLAEEWRYRSPLGRLRKAPRSGGPRKSLPPLAGLAALHQLLPGVVQAEIPDPSLREGANVFLGRHGGAKATAVSLDPYGYVARSVAATESKKRRHSAAAIGMKLRLASRGHGKYWSRDTYPLMGAGNCKGEASLTDT